MAFKPIDPKRDEFRRYLERSGVIETLTKVFVQIVKERPENPLDYLRHNLGDALHQADSVAYLQSELEEARNEIQRLRSIIESVSPETLENQPLPGRETDRVDECMVSVNQEKLKEETLFVIGNSAPLASPAVESLIKGNDIPDDVCNNLETPTTSPKVDNNSEEITSIH